MQPIVYFLFKKSFFNLETNTINSILVQKKLYYNYKNEIIARLLIFLHFYVTDCNN